MSIHSNDSRQKTTEAAENRCRAGVVTVVTILAAALLAACGGGGAASGSSVAISSSSASSGATGGQVQAAAPETGDSTTFRAYLQSRPAAANASTMAARWTAIDVAEVARRSRDWAVAALVRSTASASSNEAVLPPFHFGLANAVASAAQGDTAAQLKPFYETPVSTSVRAGLLQGLARQIEAAPQTQLSKTFLASVAADATPDIWSAFALGELPAAAVSLGGTHRLRLRITDSLDARWLSGQAKAETATVEVAAGFHQAVSLLRVSGQVIRHSAPGYGAIGLALPQGAWLVNITPEQPLNAWNADALNAALSAVTTAIAARAASDAVAGELLLPAISSFSVQGLDDRRGMALALNEVHADLRGLDNLGGVFLDAPSGKAELSLTASALRLRASQVMEFVFSPTNVNSSSFFSGGVGYTNVSVPPTPPCPAAVVDLRPSYLTVLQPGGSLTLLARLSRFEGTACIKP